MFMSPRNPELLKEEESFLRELEELEVEYEADEEDPDDPDEECHVCIDADDFYQNEGGGVWISHFLGELYRHVGRYCGDEHMCASLSIDSISPRIFSGVMDGLRQRMNHFVNEYFDTFYSEHVTVPDRYEIIPECREFCDGCGRGWSSADEDDEDAEREFVCDQDCDSFLDHVDEEIIANVTMNMGWLREKLNEEFKIFEGVDGVFVPLAADVSFGCPDGFNVGDAVKIVYPRVVMQLVGGLIQRLSPPAWVEVYDGCLATVMEIIPGSSIGYRLNIDGEKTFMSDWLEGSSFRTLHFSPGDSVILGNPSSYLKTADGLFQSMRQLVGLVATVSSVCDDAAMVRLDGLELPFPWPVLFLRPVHLPDAEWLTSRPFGGRPPSQVVLMPTDDVDASRRLSRAPHVGKKCFIASSFYASRSAGRYVVGVDEILPNGSRQLLPCRWPLRYMRPTTNYIDMLFHSRVQPMFKQPKTGEDVYWYLKDPVEDVSISVMLEELKPGKGDTDKEGQQNPTAANDFYVEFYVS